MFRVRVEEVWLPNQTNWGLLVKLVAQVTEFGDQFGGDDWVEC